MDFFWLHSKEVLITLFEVLQNSVEKIWISLFFAIGNWNWNGLVFAKYFQ